ncbi:MAG: GDSL-type esterase/lipase family protein [Sphingorhabdus sp.]
MAQKSAVFGRPLNILALLALAIGLWGCAHVEPSAARTQWTASDVAQRPYQEVGKWETAIAAYEEADKTNPPPPGSIVFVGSSSIAFWKTLTEDMAPMGVLNRGFGGSKIYDLVYYANRIVWPYKPKAIVVFSGTNDIVRPSPGAPEKVEQGFIDFIAETRAIYPGIDIHYISISPTEARSTAYQQVAETNKKIAALAKLDDRLYFIDTASATTSGGLPRTDLFRNDKLHLNAKGYAVWAAIIRAHLLSIYRRN